MKEMILIEGCFGPDIKIDGESLHQSEYDTRTKEEIDSFKMKLIDELISNRDSLDLSDWRDIADIIGNRSKDWEQVRESYDTCDQCGNYNWIKTYKKKA